MIPLLVLVVVLLALAVWVVATYNRLVRTRNKVEEAWAGVDVQLQRRSDLIPNLVDTVKGYVQHEEGVLTRLTQARAAMVQAGGVQDADTADSMLTGALKSLFAVAEDYPDLKANQGFLDLQRQLAEIEEELSFSRRYYNAIVEDMNTLVQTFPTVLVAGPLGFERATFFRADADARTAPTVDFDR